MLLLVGFAAVRVAAFTLIYHGLLGIGVSLDNPIGDDPADLPGLAFQVHASACACVRVRACVCCARVCARRAARACVRACVCTCVCRASPARSCGSLHATFPDTYPAPSPHPSPSAQVFMRRECEAFGAGVDAIDLDGSKTGHVWWEGLGSSAREESHTPRTQKPPSTYQEPHQL